MPTCLLTAFGSSIHSLVVYNGLLRIMIFEGLSYGLSDILIGWDGSIEQC